VDELAALAARGSITEVLYRYCRGLDRMDLELSYSVFHDDATAWYSGLFQGSGHGFVDWVFELHRSMSGHSHQVTNVLIEFHDDTHAVSEAYVTVRLRTTNPAGETVDILGSGRYLDHWERREGRWAIVQRRYVGDLTTTLAVPAPGAAGQIPPAGAVERLVSSRDLSDPSYHDLFQRL